MSAFFFIVVGRTHALHAAALFAGWQTIGSAQDLAGISDTGTLVYLAGDRDNFALVSVDRRGVYVADVYADVWLYDLARGAMNSYKRKWPASGKRSG